MLSYTSSYSYIAHKHVKKKARLEPVFSTHFFVISVRIRFSSITMIFCIIFSLYNQNLLLFFHNSDTTLTKQKKKKKRKKKAQNRTICLRGKGFLNGYFVCKVNRIDSIIEYLLTDLLWLGSHSFWWISHSEKWKPVKSQAGVMNLIYYFCGHHGSITTEETMDPRVQCG